MAYSGSSSIIIHKFQWNINYHKILQLILHITNICAKNYVFLMIQHTIHYSPPFPSFNGLCKIRVCSLFLRSTSTFPRASNIPFASRHQLAFHQSVAVHSHRMFFPLGTWLLSFIYIMLIAHIYISNEISWIEIIYLFQNSHLDKL